MIIEEAYDILGASSSNSFDEIKAKWKRISLIYHPDKNYGISDQLKSYYTRVFTNSTNAWDFLKINHIQTFPTNSDQPNNNNENSQSEDTSTSESSYNSDNINNSRRFNRENERPSRDLYCHYSEPSHIKCDKCGIVKRRNNFSKNMTRKRKYIKINNHLARQTGGPIKSAFIICKNCPY